MARDGASATGPMSQRAPWTLVWTALAISVLGTALLGGILFAIDRNVWWIMLSGALSLIAGGGYMGFRSREAEPLYGSLLAILYFGLVVGILFGGSRVEELPEPLPGLGIGDSTFFFVSPLLMLSASVVGTVVGGRVSNRRTRPPTHGASETV